MHSLKGKGQPVSTSWLQSPDERDRSALLEYTRGVVYSLAFSGERGRRESRAIHSARIRSAFSNLGSPTIYRVGLRLIQLFREAEPLFGGYWLLTPFRVIEVESRYAFVGAVPSAKLSDIRREGLGRFISEESASRFPVQSIDGWMGLTATPVSGCVRNFVATHRELSAITFDAQDIEFFKVVGNGLNGRRFAWTRQPYAIVAAERIALCRQKRCGVYRYFSADLRAGAVLSEAPIGQSLTRLMFALANVTSSPVSIKINQRVANTEIIVSERLPIEEYRLALLLASNISRLGNATSYCLDTSLAPAFLKQLSALGCSLEIAK